MFRLPDSTSGELRSPDSSSASNSSSSSSSSTGDEEEEDDDDGSELNIGGCSSGCCLASPRPPCDVANLKDVEEEKEEGGPTGATEKASADNLVEEGDLKNPDEIKENIGKSTDLTLESAQEETDEENLAREDEIKSGSLTGGTEDPIPGAKTSCPKMAGKVTLKKDTEEAREKKIAVEQKEESSEGKSSEDGLSK